MACPILTTLLKRPREEGARALLAAIVADAVRLVAHAPPRRQRARERFHADEERREAARWLLVRDARHPFSFAAICGVLDLDAEAIRQELQREYDLVSMTHRQYEDRGSSCGPSGSVRGET